ncbi:MAG: 30S ribosome-binding factor RbfA [Anaerolineae bacterium]|nr:30S ribosome-binding factor RbfA [Anaerolineae bacterium]
MSGRIRDILSALLMREVNDPRLEGVTVTSVKLDPELMFATVMVNALGDEERRDEIMAGLKRAKGFLRREVASRVRLRNAPELLFRWDEGLERAERVNRLFDKLVIPPPPPKEETDDDDDDLLD